MALLDPKLLPAYRAYSGSSAVFNNADMWKNNCGIWQMGLDVLFVGSPGSWHWWNLSYLLQILHSSDESLGFDNADMWEKIVACGRSRFLNFESWVIPETYTRLCRGHRTGTQMVRLREILSFFACVAASSNNSK